LLLIYFSRADQETREESKTLNGKHKTASQAQAARQESENEKPLYQELIELIVNWFRNRFLAKLDG
jgi:hypothetical protein